jgi:hypothetical protein
MGPLGNSASLQSFRGATSGTEDRFSDTVLCQNPLHTLRPLDYCAGHFNAGKVEDALNQTLRVTPAMAADVTDRLWSIEDIAALVD